MKVQFSIVGQVDPYGAVWVDLDAIPSEGDVVSLPRLSQAETVVRTVVWYPTHDDDGIRLAEPFVYIVLGPPRP